MQPFGGVLRPSCPNRWRPPDPLIWIFNIFGTADLLNAFYQGNRLSLGYTPGSGFAAWYWPLTWQRRNRRGFVPAFLTPTRPQLAQEEYHWPTIVSSPPVRSDPI